MSKLGWYCLMQALLFNFVGFYVVTIFLFGLWKSKTTISGVEGSLRRLPLPFKILIAAHLIGYILYKPLGLFSSEYFGWIHFLIDTASFLVHEAGHIYFSLFGSFISSLGGTLTELLLPAIVVIFSVHRSCYSLAGLMIFWIGQILLGTSEYIASAPTSNLDAHFEGIHDWNNMLGMLSALEYADELSIVVLCFAYFFLGAGVLVYAFGSTSKLSE